MSSVDHRESVCDCSALVFIKGIRLNRVANEAPLRAADYDPPSNCGGFASVWLAGYSDWTAGEVFAKIFKVTPSRASSTPFSILTIKVSMIGSAASSICRESRT